MVYITSTSSESIAGGSVCLGRLGVSFGKGFAFGVLVLVLVVVLVFLAAIFLSLDSDSTDSLEDDLVSSMFDFDAALPVLAFATVFAIVPFIKCDTNECYEATVDVKVSDLLRFTSLQTFLV